MKTQELRQTFIDYFKKNGHQTVTSSSLVPENDKTLLFANAGMNQFKNVFLGLEHRDYKRAVSVQKCVRAGGKHNDLENVGHTARHHTFFEMLGNFSFGDYGKKDAIHFSWDLLTKEIGIDKNRLYVSVHIDDQESADIWHKQEGVAKERIYRFDEDNFWRMGEIGPCGPSTEIFYDHGPEYDDPSQPSKMGEDGDRYIEIWNNVFMQFVEDENGRRPLPKLSVDTGGGLERWAAMMSQTNNNFNTDLFFPIINATCEISKSDLPQLIEIERLAMRDQSPKIKGVDRFAAQQELAALRVLADHSRATAFLIADGVTPSNEGRGYVLRRMMRRAIRYGRKLSEDPHLFLVTVMKVVAEMSAAYPELTRNKELISASVRDETTRFLTTLDQGTEILNAELKKLASKNQKVLSGDVVFKLYDTFGFPVDLTRVMTEENGMKIDEDNFMSRMEQAREQAKASSNFKAISSDAAHLIQLSQSVIDDQGPTLFLGYTSTSSHGKILALSNGFNSIDTLKAGEDGIVALNSTCFYAESGGQVGDHGTITSDQGATAEVYDCTKQNDVFFHHIRVIDGQFNINDSCLLLVTDSKRRATASNHSATHLLHAALRKIIGKSVTQAGSHVDADRLRFDYTHNKPLSSSEILQIEACVNEEISNVIEINTAEMEHQAAIDAGAMALFGEKYGDKVRVVKMGEFSTELCGGTHVSNTAMIRVFKIVSDNGVSSGVRRIEAITGATAVEYLLKNTRENESGRTTAGIQESWSQYLSDEALHRESTISTWIEQAKSTIKTLEREIKQLKGSAIDIESLVKTSKPFLHDGLKGQLVTAALELEDRQILSELSDKIKNKVQTGVVVLVGKGESKHPIVVSVSKNLTTTFSAGKLLAEVARELKGKGGGRPDFAQGAGEDLSRLEQAFRAAEAYVSATPQKP